MATRVRSFSKVNLGLRIGPARADGFHGLATVYQTLRLHDMVTIGARRVVAGRAGVGAATRITIRTDHPRVPTDARNTVWKMVERACEAMGVVAEVEVRIEKRLPVQGGLGAGSANAAAALLGLERELWGGAGGGGRRLGGTERLALAAEVGSDVPLFLLGGSVLGMGRGEQVVPLPELAGTGSVPCVVAVPRVGVSTPMAFREWDRREAERGAGAACGMLAASSLTPPAPPDTLLELNLLCSSAYVPSGFREARAGEQLEATGVDRVDPEHARGESARGEAGEEAVDLAQSPLLSLVHAGVENDFEDVVFGFHPSLGDLKQGLVGAQASEPAVYAALSGSGSALFGLYRTKEGASAAAARVEALGAEARRTGTLSRASFWATVFA